jgi:branched-chain amino acid transport system substrate-binding protein
MRQPLLCALVVIASVLSRPVAAEIAIGLANPLSGPYATSGGRNRAAVSLAIEDLNARGGVLGEPLRLVVADDACGLEQAVTAARRLVEAGVRLVIGHMCSHSSLMAAAVYDAANVLMISPDSTHPRLTEEGRHNVFRLVGRDDRQAELAGAFLARNYPGRNIAIVHDGSVYGKGLASRTRRQLRQLGVVEVLFASYPPGGQDYGVLAARLLCAGVDVLYVGGYGPDAARILRAVRVRGDDLQLIGGDGLGMAEFWAIAGEAGAGTLFSARPAVHWTGDAAALRARFLLRGAGPGSGGVAAYGAVETWAQAVERAGSDKFAAVEDVLRRGRFETLLGRVAFDDKCDLHGAGWQIQVWNDGDYAPLGPGTASN